MPTTYSPRVVRYFPRGHRPALLLVGEAPGPRGADRTGYPFWGDDSGLDLYGLIGALGLFDAPFTPWKRRADLTGTSPPPGRYAITNACPQMPLLPDGGFCAPEPARLDAEAARLREELQALAPRVVLTCGKAAAYTLSRASLLEGSTPPAPLATKFSNLRLLEAMAELVAQPDATHWRVGGALAFVTTHPARGQWAPSTPSGKLHAQVVERLRAALSSA